MPKDELIKDFGDLQLAIQFEDIPVIIHQISIHKIKSRGLEEFTRGLLMDNIKQYIIYKKREKLRINRANEYGDPTFDMYRIGGDGYNTWERYYTEYICTKCGKKKKVFK